MGLTAIEAEAVRQRTFEISENSSKLADTQGKIVILQKQIVQSQKEINDTLDTQIDLTQELGVFGQELLAQSSILRDNFGLSAEAIAELDKEAIRTGKSVEDITKETFGTIAAIGLEKGILLDVNKILTEATKIQGNLRLSFKGSTAELAKAVAQAKLLGLTLQQSEKTAESLLNFEQSIEAELTAELLTGRQLNLDRARLAALNGDFLQVAKEINAQGITYNQLQGMNLIQRKAIAESVGLEVNELADALKQQKEYNALQTRALAMGVRIANVEEKSLKQIYEENKNVLGSEKDLIKVLGEELYLKKQTEDAQEKFNKTLDKAKESFARLVDSGAIDQFATILTQFINKIASGKSIMGALFGSYSEQDQLQQEAVVEGTRDYYGRGQLKEGYQYKKTGFREGYARAMAGQSPEIIKAEDFTIRTHPKDELVIAGGTNLSGGSNQEMLGLMKQLISATEQNRQVTVSVNGEAVFSAMGRTPMK
jgi:hypothetical protein